MSITSRSTDRGLLVLRLVVALIFIVHGYMKLFVMGHGGVTGFFTQLGIPLPGVAAWGISLLEFGGGLALAAGIFTRPLALLLACDMVTAILLALLPKGLVGGYEFELLLAAGSLALALAGSGGYSLDARLKSRSS